ncbi:unnamed protein product [Pleuronectes platessa]|uniref:Uncharacterized protein n=1 Tax=Pleuronectes platessa TaxID=8262 RepID=A0A9N7Z9A7_PLEPL|nr:unnamed protein product [Pleuronectes platessa]
MLEDLEKTFTGTGINMQTPHREQEETRIRSGKLLAWATVELAGSVRSPDAGIESSECCHMLDLGGASSKCAEQRDSDHELRALAEENNMAGIRQLQSPRQAGLQSARKGHAHTPESWPVSQLSLTPAQLPSPAYPHAWVMSLLKSLACYPRMHSNASRQHPLACAAPTSPHARITGRASSPPPPPHQYSKVNNTSRVEQYQAPAAPAKILLVPAHPFLTPFIST